MIGGIHRLRPSIFLDFSGLLWLARASSQAFSPYTGEFQSLVRHTHGSRASLRGLLLGGKGSFPHSSALTLDPVSNPADHVTRPRVHGHIGKSPTPHGLRLRSPSHEKALLQDQVWLYKAVLGLHRMGSHGVFRYPGPKHFPRLFPAKKPKSVASCSPRSQSA